MDNNKESTFEVTIDFERGSGDPTRVFRTMSDLIEAFESLDKHLLSSFDVALSTSLVLDEVETGSLKARFRDLIAGVPDEALKDGEWKKILGHFLLRAKYAILNWLNDQDDTVNRENVRDLEEAIAKIAEDTNIKQLPAYGAPRADVLLSDVRSIQESLGHLDNNDSAAYEYDGQKISFNRELEISSEIVRDVLTKEVVKLSSRQVVKVKKPDYLGKSMWSFQYAGHSIDAKISHTDWLYDFQKRAIDVRPGDALRVLLYEETSYGYDQEIVHCHYEIEKVYEVIRPPSQGQIDF